MRNAIFLLAGCTLLLPSVGSANDFSPRIWDYLFTLPARVQVTRAARQHFLDTVVKSRGDSMGKRTLEVGGKVLGGPKVKLKVSLRDVWRNHYGGKVSRADEVFKVRATYKGRTYEQFFTRQKRGTTTIGPVSHNSNKGTFFRRNNAWPKKTWRRVRR